MADKVFCGRAFTPRSQYAVSETSYNLDDLELMRKWAEANDGRVTVSTSKAKSGKLYSEINTYKKNPPGQVHRYTEEDRPPSQHDAGKANGSGYGSGYGSGDGSGDGYG